MKKDISEITIDDAIQIGLESTKTASDFLDSLPPQVKITFLDWVKEQSRQHNGEVTDETVYGFMGQAFEVGYHMRGIIDSYE